MPLQKQFDVDDVLDSAMEAFWERGYEATSVRDLVECTGVNRGSLYANYGDKRALFLAALRRYEETVLSRTLADLEARLGPRDAIRGVFELFAEPARRGRPARGCLIANSTLELAAHDGEVREIVAGAQHRIETFFARMIEQGRARGEIAARVKAREAAGGLLASLLGMVVLTRSRPEEALLGAVIDDAMGHLT